MKKTTKPQPTRISTVSIRLNGIEWTASATTQAEALAAIAAAAEQERAGK